MLSAQERLLDVIDAGTAAFGAYTPSPQPTAKALTDIRAIAGRVLTDLPEQNIKSLLPPDITQEYFAADPGSPCVLRNDPGSWPRPGRLARPSR
ncbi:hypothetical protein [Streptomyces ureilyticus]|uniref:hypothetical protein n=1 Tax=Streptomyces ureilyticus TaxID=1775131 RepID=UPI001F1D5F6B|nr:hypothetical protein [Streptomyces ureilyticus]